MNQKQFKLNKRLWDLKAARRRLLLAMQGDSQLAKLYYVRQVRRLKADVKMILYRSMSISSHVFNINSYSEEACLRDFRFQRHETPQVMERVGWNIGRTQRNRYSCSPFVETCTILRKLAYPCRWSYIECKFGMHSSQLSEIFYEVVQSLFDTR
eukprot:IDg5051t1